MLPIEPLVTAPALDLTPQDIVGLLEELHAYHAIYAPLFQRREQRDWAACYLRGLLSALPRKAIEPMVLALAGADRDAVRGLQQFVSAGSWDDAALLCRHWQEVDAALGDDEGVLTLDGGDFPKQGRGRSGSSASTAASWASGRTARRGSSWATPASTGTPCWTAACTCPRSGSKTRPSPRGATHAASPPTRPSRPNQPWVGQ